MADNFKTDPFRRRLAELDSEVEQWRSKWWDIVRFFLPHKGRYLNGGGGKPNDGTRSYKDIINATGTDALRTLAAGMQGGLTSPSRPWFALGLPQREDLAEVSAVRMWLHDVRNIILDTMAQSNFYDTTHGGYEELAGFGTAAILVEEDDETIVRFSLFTAGEYMLALNAKGKAEALYRRFTMSSIQLLDKFGKENLTDTVLRDLKNNKTLHNKHTVIHAIQLRANRDPLNPTPRGMKYQSIWFLEKESDKDHVLRDSGYRDQPFAAPRWSFAANDIYGTGPAFDVLSDTKMLQKMEELKLKKINKNVDPPMNAPPSMKGAGGTIVSGGINYVDPGGGNQSFVPAYHPDANVDSIALEIQRVELRIKKLMYNDLFLSLLSRTKRMTATEVEEMGEERLLVLGPVLERLETEMLEVIITRVFNILLRAGALPEIPPELAGQSIEIEYISTLAQAQRAVGAKSIEQTANAVAGLAGINPTVVDKFDADEALDQIAVMTGAPPRIIRSDDAVAEIREQRAQQEQQQQMMAAASVASKSVKELSEADMGADSALSRVAEGLS